MDNFFQLLEGIPCARWYSLIYYLGRSHESYFYHLLGQWLQPGLWIALRYGEFCDPEGMWAEET